MKIYVGGSLNSAPRDPKLCGDFVTALGEAIAKNGHVLLTGCRSSLDKEIATAADRWLKDNAGSPKDKIISYWSEGGTPDDARSHAIGTIRRSALSDWGLNHAKLVVPEQINQADATIFVAGGRGHLLCEKLVLLRQETHSGNSAFRRGGGRHL